MKRFLAVIALSACALSAWALPSTDNVQAEINRGDYAKAEAMMLEVVTARPGSAKAHYVYAEILAHNKHFDQAVEEAAAAQKIDPSLQFTQPDKFRAFEQLLNREQAAGRRSAAVSANPGATAMAPAQALPQRSSGLPAWVWGVGAIAIALLLWRLVGARRAAPAAGPYAPSAGAGPSYANGYGPAYPPAPAPGGGLLGTGMAVAGGVAAGMLAEKLLDGRRDSGGLFGSSHGDASTPGLFGNPGDNDAARDLEQRPVDFGSGGDWGGDDGGSSGGDDGGSSGGGDGGW